MNISKYLILTLTLTGLSLAASCSKQSSVSNVIDDNVSSLVIIKSAEPESENEEKSSPDNSGHRQLGVHVHGAASMNVTVERDQLNITMSIPGMDAVGFEHAAVSDEDQKKLNETLNYLRKPNTIFVTPADAQCQLIKGKVATALLNKEAKANSHADVDISYEWQCKNSSSLNNISVKLFTRFPHLQKVKASWITQDKQGAAELTSADTLLKLE